MILTLELATFPLAFTESLSQLWENYWVFITMVVFGAGVIGMASRSMAVAAMGAYVTFAWLAVETGETLLENILYVTLTLVFIGFAFKLWRLEGPGGEPA